MDVPDELLATLRPVMEACEDSEVTHLWNSIEALGHLPNKTGEEHQEMNRLVYRLGLRIATLRKVEKTDFLQAENAQVTTQKKAMKAGFGKSASIVIGMAASAYSYGESEETFLRDFQKYPGNQTAGWA